MVISGWFRQCDVIPYSEDVDIGVWIKDYDVRLIPAMQMNGMPLKYLFGKVSHTKHSYMDGCMDRWILWMDGQMDVMDGWMDRWMYGCMLWTD